MGGGNSGGGGGGMGSGVVDYPAHMKTWHQDAMDDTGADVLATSMNDAMNAAIGSSPWTAAVPYDPSADITAYEAAIAGFDALIAGITETTDWDALFTQAVASITVADKSITGITDAEILVDSAAFAASLDNQITTVVLPRFQAGMLDINAVVSSAFVLGQSNIEGFRDTDVAKHESGLRVDAAKVNAQVDVQEAQMNLNKDVQVTQIQISAADQMLRIYLNRYAWEESYMKVVVEGKRLKIIASKEESDLGYEYDEKDALWDLEVFQYGGNLLASIGGGVLNPKSTKPSGAQSVIGGALSGAASGAMIGSAVPGIGTAIGAGIGGLLGAASGLL
jgi:hypothetical protein